jgi:Rrf2 family protein
VYLAQRQDATPARKNEIAKAEGISPDYVEQILVRLRASKLVSSHRGVKGGFLLAKPADRITVADVVETLEGPIQLVSACEDGPCARASQCVTRDVWKEATRALVQVLASKTIEELKNEAAAHTRARQTNYDI